MREMFLTRPSVPWHVGWDHRHVHVRQQMNVARLRLESRFLLMSTASSRHDAYKRTDLAGTPAVAITAPAVSAVREPVRLARDPAGALGLPFVAPGGTCLRIDDGGVASCPLPSRPPERPCRASGGDRRRLLSRPSEPECSGASRVSVTYIRELFHEP